MTGGADRSYPVVRQDLPGRGSGVLLHVPSLPGPFGAGDLGAGAARFVDFLERAGQSWWQTLPVGPPGFGDSPYMGTSAFALDPHWIDLFAVRDQGLLGERDLRSELPAVTERALFAESGAFRDLALEKAAEAFFHGAGHEEQGAFEAFCAEQGAWLPDYALFRALKERSGDLSWTRWEAGLAHRDPEALARARDDLGAAIRRISWCQYEADRQWRAMRDRCRERGIGLIGDIPIFVAHESADVWSRPELFHLDDAGNPTVVAGVPPDYFSRTGQRWGHPLYRWEVLKEDGYAWWLARLRRTFSLSDLVRLDHFIGFRRYWEIPAASPTAVEGRWMPGPGEDFLNAAVAEFGRVGIIAEDLGAVAEDVVTLRRQFGLPGMRVLQFAFGSGPHNNHLPHRHEPDLVVYPGTHDNDTVVGWYRELLNRAGRLAGPRSPVPPDATDPADRKAAETELDFLLRYLGLEENRIPGGIERLEIHWEMIRLAFSSVARLAVIQAQDALGLDSWARMNFPSRAEGNWSWRLRPDALDQEVTARLRLLTRTFGRLREANADPE